MVSLFPVTARGLWVRKNSVLLLENRRLGAPYHVVPGGHVEKGENAEHAVVRELFEELGLSCTVKRFLGLHENNYINRKGELLAGYHLYFLIDAGAQEPVQQEALLKPVWTPLAILPTLTLQPTALVHMVPEWLKGAGIFYSSSPFQTRATLYNT